MKKLAGTYFCGNQASDYAIEHGYLDYATLAKSFDAVLANNIILDTSDLGYWEQVSGFVNNSDEIEELEERIEELEERIEELEEEKEEATDERYDAIKEEIKAIEEEVEELEEEIEELKKEESGDDIFQYFIVSNQGAEILEEINEIVFYNDSLDLYVWGVTHYGTSWSYVLTDIKLNCGDDAFN